MKGKQIQVPRRYQRDAVQLSDVRFVAASAPEIEEGLLGWIRCRINQSMIIDGITLRKTAAGRFALSFPSRTDSRGRRHFCIRPANDRARNLIEHEILGALGLVEVPR